MGWFEVINTPKEHITSASEQYWKMKKEQEKSDQS